MERELLNFLEIFCNIIYDIQDLKYKLSVMTWKGASFVLSTLLTFLNMLLNVKTLYLYCKYSIKQPTHDTRCSISTKKMGIKTYNN